MNEKYYHTKESVEEYIELSKDVDGRELISKLKQFLPLGKTILEIGSGPGSDWQILTESYKVIGSDNSKNFIEHLKRNNPGGDFLELDATTLLTNLRFEGIYSNKVLHHLSDKELVKSIKRQFEILHADGIICHSFWKGIGSEVYNGLLINYQSKQSLLDLFQKSFQILFLEEYSEFEESDSLLIIGMKRQRPLT